MRPDKYYIKVQVKLHPPLQHQLEVFMDGSHICRIRNFEGRIFSAQEFNTIVREAQDIVTLMYGGMS